YRVVGRGYFASVGTPIVRGRDFNAGDDKAGPAVTIVNAAFAAHEWPGEDPIGKRVRVAGMDGGVEPWTTVVGVAANARTTSPTRGFSGTYYFDYRQRPMYRVRSVSYIVRSTVPPDALIPAVRSTLSAIGPQVPTVFQSYDNIVASSVADRRFMML